MKCDMCGYNNKDNLNYCERCGNKLFIFCGKCGFKNTRNSTFCSGCGELLNCDEFEQKINTNVNQQDFNQQSHNDISNQQDDNLYYNQQHIKPTQQGYKQNSLNYSDEGIERFNQSAVLITTVLSVILARIIFGYFVADLYYFKIISNSFYTILLYFEFVLCGLFIGIIYTYLTRNSNENESSVFKNICISSFFSILIIVFINLLDNNYSYGFDIYLMVYLIYLVLFVICGSIGRHIIKPFISETGHTKPKKGSSTLYNRKPLSCMIITLIVSIVATVFVTIIYYYINKGNMLGYFARFYLILVLMNIVIGMLYSYLIEKRRDTELRDIALISFITTITYVSCLYLLGDYVSSINWVVFYMSMSMLSGLLGTCLYRNYTN